MKNALSCGRDMPVIHCWLHPHVFVVEGGDSRGGRQSSRGGCGDGGRRLLTVDDDTINEVSVIIIVIVAFIYVVEYCQLHPHVFAFGGGDSRGGWLFLQRGVRCAGGRRMMRTDDDTTDDLSIIVVVVLAFVDVFGGSGDEGTKMQSLAFFGLVKIANRIYCTSTSRVTIWNMSWSVEEGGTQVPCERKNQLSCWRNV